MSSLFEGYNYDIFISYRQKDNVQNNWISRFVQDLRGELETTFKDRVSIYFDVSPEDGLLETHDVEASLKEKLKCLVFIPIVSRTYCDPRSFAWNHEFKAFLNFAASDELGLKVKLPGGNVASRVLPVQIHELDPSDKRLFENELKGFLRGIEFIYKEPGVNKPLTPDDNDKKNRNGTKYQIQLNKTANAILEIIRGINAEIEKSHAADDDSFERSDTKNSNQEFQEKTHRRRQRTYLNIIKSFLAENHRKAGISLIVITSILAMLFSLKSLPKIRNVMNPGMKDSRMLVEKAVIHFNNNEFEEARALAENALAKDMRNSDAWSTLAAINVKHGNLDQAVIQTIEAVKCDPKNHEAAYNMAFALDDKKDYTQAAEWYSKSIQIDSSFVPAYSALGRLYNNINRPIDAILLLSKARKKFPQSEFRYLIFKNLGNAFRLQMQLDSAIRYLELSKALKPSEPETSLFLAQAYEESGKLGKCLEAWQEYIDLESDSTAAGMARMHLKELSLKQLNKILK